MSYGIKYRGQFLKRDETSCKFEILQKNYSGGITDVVCSDTPVLISNEGSNIDPLTPIIGASITIEITATGDPLQFIEFMYAKNREYMIKYYEDDTIRFNAFVLPDNYQQIYIGYRPKITIVGTDQLGDLRNFEYKKAQTLNSLVTEWENWESALEYDTFVSDDHSILSAISDGSAYAYARSVESFSVKTGEVVVFEAYLNSISGQVPFIYLYSESIGLSAKSNVPNLAQGYNKLFLTATASYNDMKIAIGNSESAANWMASVIMVRHGDQYRLGWEKDSVIIANILRETGFELDIWENINLVEQFQEYMRLSQVESNQEVFLVEDDKGLMKAWNCYDALKEMLKPYGAQIRQEDGAWYITRPDNMRGESSIRKYDKWGEYVSSTTLDPIKQFTSSSASQVLRPVAQSGKLSSIPGWRHTMLFQDYGYLNLILNGSFEDIAFDSTGIDLKYWEQKNTPSFMHYPRDEKRKCLMIYSGSGTGASATDPHLLYKIPISITAAKQRFRLKFDAMVQADDTAIGDGVYTGLRIWIDSTSGDKALVVKTTGEKNILTEESDVSNTKIVKAQFTKSGQWETFEFEMEAAITVTGTMYIECHRHQLASGSGGTISYSYIDNIELYTAKANDVVTDKEQHWQFLNVDNNLIPDEESYYFGDGYGLQLSGVQPDDLYLYKGQKKSIYTSGTRYRTGRWLNYESSYVGARTLLDWLNMFMKTMRTNPVQVFRGTLYGKCKMYSVYQDEANGDKLFYTGLVQQYNPREDTWNITSFELPVQDLEVQLDADSLDTEIEIIIPDIEVEPVPEPDVEVTAVGEIDNGTVSEEMTSAGFFYNNTGDEGEVTIYWQIWDSSESSLIDAGNQLVLCVEGINFANLTGISYPGSSGFYKLFVKETDDADYEKSDIFEVYDL